MKINKERLLILANTIERSHKFQFDMGLFRDIDVMKQKKTHACGTVACALGHGPLNKELAPTEACFFFASYDGKTYLDWDTYAEKVFGVRYTSPAWQWMFSGRWSASDNTRKGAAARIQHYVKKGLPANWYAQMHGRAKLSYQVSP